MVRWRRAISAMEHRRGSIVFDNHLSCTGHRPPSIGSRSAKEVVFMLDNSKTNKGAGPMRKKPPAKVANMLRIKGPGTTTIKPSETIGALARRLQQERPDSSQGSGPRMRLSNQTRKVGEFGMRHAS
jgi:hypothetical protein